MSRKMIPCPKCGELCSGQGEKCWDCFAQEQNKKRIASETCPRCDGDKHRQSSLCRECHLEENRKPQNYVTKMCPVCGNQFTVHQTQINSGNGKYCSRSCARSGSPTKKRTKLQVQCHSCGKKFSKHKSEIKRTNGEFHFCSKECWQIYNQGENHYGYMGGSSPERQAFTSSREWKQTAKKIWKRDKAQCQRCGIKKEFYRDGLFHVHHIVSFQVNELRIELNNLILFCDKCHWWVHSNNNTERQWTEDYDYPT